MLATHTFVGYLSRSVCLRSGTRRLGFFLLLGLFGISVWQGLCDVTEAAAKGHWPAPVAAGFAVRTPAIQTGGVCDGRFTAGLTPTTGANPTSAVVGDVNSDNKLDLAVINIGDNNLTIQLGNGAGGFTQAVGSPIGVGSVPGSMAVEDLNLDQKSDLAVVNRLGQL